MTSLITMPDIKAFNYTFRCSYNVAESTSPFSFSVQTYDWAVARWEGEVTFQTHAYAKRDDQMALRAFVSQLRGKLNVFNYGDPEYLVRGPRGVATGTPLVKGAAQTGITLLTDGWTVSTTGILKAGDYVQLGTGSNAQLYQSVTDVNSDGSGNATITLNRPLLSVPSDNGAIIVTGAKSVFRLAENDTSWQGDPTGSSTITLAFKEAI